MEIPLPSQLNVIATNDGINNVVTEEEPWQTVERRARKTSPAPQNTTEALELPSPPRKQRKRTRQFVKDIHSNSNINTTKVWNKFFIIFKKDGDFSQTSPIKLCKLINTAIGTATNIKKISGGRVSVETASPEQSDKLGSLDKLDDVPITVTPNARLNTSQGVITCRDLMICEEQEILDELEGQGVLNVRRIMRKVNGEMKPTASLVLTFNRPQPTQIVTVAYYRLSVRPYIPAPLRCFKCLKFGHTSLRCKAQEHMCGCGLPIHGDSTCRDPPVCLNCGAPHNTRSPECCVFVIEKEIQRLKTEKKLPYHEARNLVKCSAYVMPNITYAKTTATIRSRGREISTQTESQSLFQFTGRAAASKPSLPSLPLATVGAEAPTGPLDTSKPIGEEPGGQVPTMSNPLRVQADIGNQVSTAAMPAAEENEPMVHSMEPPVPIKEHAPADNAFQQENITAESEEGSANTSETRPVTRSKKKKKKAEWQREQLLRENNSQRTRPRPHNKKKGSS